MHPDHVLTRLGAYEHINPGNGYIRKRLEVFVIFFTSHGVLDIVPAWQIKIPVFM